MLFRNLSVNNNAMLASGFHFDGGETFVERAERTPTVFDQEARFLRLPVTKNGFKAVSVWKCHKVLTLHARLPQCRSQHQQDLPARPRVGTARGLSRCDG